MSIVSPRDDGLQVRDPRPEPPPEAYGIEEDDFLGWPDGRIGRFLRTPAPPVDWFCRDRLLAGRGQALAGLGGSSKTRVICHLGVGAVVGRLPWDWELLKTGSAALFLKEDVPDQVHRTVQSLCVECTEDEIKLLEDRLRIFPLAAHPAILLALRGDVLESTAALTWLREKVRELPQPVVFIGIDPAIGFTEGDELSQTHQRRLGELVDHLAIDTGACVLLSTHSAKGLAGLEEVGSHSSRGAGALTDALRAEFVIRAMTFAEARRFGVTDVVERKAHSQLVATKGNELPPDAYAPIWLRRDQHGLRQAELSADGADPLSKRERDAYDVLKKCNAGAPIVFKEWVAACVAAGILERKADGKAHERMLARMRERLVKAGKVVPGNRKGLWVAVDDDSD